MNLSARTGDAELMDTDCRDFEDYRACLSDLSRVNVWTFTYRPTLRFIRRAARRGARVSVLDVASGYGDMLRAIRGRCGDRVGALTGIDLNPWAIRAAREATPAGTEIGFREGDALAVGSAERFDLIICAQFTHHLAEDEVVAFLRWLDASAVRGWFISDIHRHWGAYAGFWVLSWAMRWHRFVRYDGLVSVRRAFTPADWRRMIAAAGLETPEVRLEWYWPFRLCVGRIKPSADGL